MMWMDVYIMLDGARGVDAVASMLYLDYGRGNPGTGCPTVTEEEKIEEAVAFLQKTQHLRVSLESPQSS